MPFYNEDTNCNKKYSDHIKNYDGDADKNDIKNKVILPPVNFFAGILSKSPKSNVLTQLFTDPNNNVEFDFSFPGYIEEVRLELNLRVNPAGGNVSVVGPFLLNKYELFSTSGSVMETWEGTGLYLEFCSQSIDEAGFEKNSMGVSSNYNAIGPFVPGTNLRLNIRLPLSITTAEIKGGITEPYTLRVYFSPLGDRKSVV